MKCNTRANSPSGRITRNHSIAQTTRNHSSAHLAAKTLLASESSASFIMSILCTALKCQLSANLNVFQPRSQGLSSNRPLGRARRDPGLVWSRATLTIENIREGSSVIRQFVALRPTLLRIVYIPAFI